MAKTPTDTPTGLSLSCWHASPSDTVSQAPSLVAPSAESIALFGQPVEFPRVDVAQPTLDRPFVVALPHEPTPEERAETRQAEKDVLDAMSVEDRRAIFGIDGGGGSGDAPLPEFYNKHKNQCPEGGACYEAHKIPKPDGSYRRGRKHFVDCAQGIALAADNKLRKR